MERAASGARGTVRPSLRTYGKRTSTTANTEPLVKKRRVGTGDVDIHSIAGRFSQKSELLAQPAEKARPQSSPPLPVQQPKKGTILSYFKVRSPSSGTASPCALSSEVVVPSSTPTSSMPVVEVSRKKPRKLTTKPPLRTHVPQDEEPETTEGDDVDERSLEKTQQDNSALQDTKTNLLSKQPTWEADGSAAGERGGYKRRKIKQATVQTTLSLSLTEKQFVECTDCNLLYNPYHEKDVKMHKKQHAAVLRSQKTVVSNGA